jgi:hypothetical protein
VEDERRLGAGCGQPNDSRRLVLAAWVLWDAVVCGRLELMGTSVTL